MYTNFRSLIIEEKDILKMIELDGSYLEGGGSLVRVALALSTLTGKEFTVSQIRSGRQDPGLKAQLLTAIKALKEMCNAETNNIDIGSTELSYKPGKIKSGSYTFDIGTAGSITLFLQAIILPSMFAPRKITIRVKGGTSGKWQASVDYLQHILLPHLTKFVEKIELKILKRGYYPKGGGEIQLEISPKYKSNTFDTFDYFYEEIQQIPKIHLTEQGTLEQIRGVVNVSLELQEKKVGERIAQAAEGYLKKYNVPINVRVDYARSSSIGGEIVLWAVFSKEGDVNPLNPVILGGDALIEKGKSSEEIGKEAAEELAQEIDSGAAVDSHLADQLISFMGLLPGSAMNVSNVTKHTQTNFYVVEHFLPVGFLVEGKMIRVEQN